MNQSNLKCDIYMYHMAECSLFLITSANRGYPGTCRLPMQ